MAGRPDKTKLPADECRPRPASTVACTDSSRGRVAGGAGRGSARRRPVVRLECRCEPRMLGLSKTYDRMDTTAAPPIRLTEFSHGGGCGCKIAPGVLRELISKSSPGLLPKELLVGIETSDDAAVYRLNDRQAIVATTDFFTPIVDDPFAFGAIAATNALSDIYAMGATPLFALALVAMPLDRLPLDVIKRILEGGESICARAGIPVAGGHTIDTVEPIYGLVAIGVLDPRHLKRNA